MAYVLILMMIDVHGNSMTSAQFRTELACQWAGEKAKAAVAMTDGYVRLTYLCEPVFKE